MTETKTKEMEIMKHLIVNVINKYFEPVIYHRIVDDWIYQAFKDSGYHEYVDVEVKNVD